MKAADARAARRRLLALILLSLGLVAGGAKDAAARTASPAAEALPPPARAPAAATPPAPATPDPAAPQTATPGAAAPEAAAPGAAVPETAVPETAVPETAVPETAVPETAVPETAVPETAVPETAVPETAVPETAVPETAAPETAAPEAARTETATTDTVLTEPAAPDPAALEAAALYETVVVSRRKAPTSTVTRLTRDDIRATGATTVPEMLELVPGVEVNDHPKAGGTLQLRGLDERASLLLVDGIPLRDAYAGHFDISSLLAAQVKSVEVDRGVTSVLYGPGSMGGVVSLTSNAVSSGTSAAVTLQGGNVAGARLLDRSARGEVATRLGDWSFAAALAYDRSLGFVVADGFTTTSDTAEFHEDGGLRAGSDYTKAMAMAKATYAPSPELSLAILGHAFLQDRGIPTFEGAAYTRYWRFTDYDTYLLGLIIDWRPDGGAPFGLTALKSAAYVARHDDTIADYEDDSCSSLTTNPLAWFVASSYRSHSAGAVLTPSFSPAADNRLEGSFAVHYDLAEQREIPVLTDRINDEWTPWASYSSVLGNLALEDTQRLGALRVSAGAGTSALRLVAEEIRGKRYPVSARFITAVDARLFADYELSGGLRLLAAAGHKTRYPTLKELFANSVGGNASLRPEEGLMTEAGADWRPAATPLRLGVRAFYNSLQNLIEQRYDRFANVARATTTGAELSAAYTPAAFLTVQAAYTYLYARDETDERPLDYRSPHSAGLDARVTTPWGTELASQLLYRSGQRAAYYDSAAGAMHEDELPGYVLLNAYLQHRLALAGDLAATIYLKGRNLLDANYVRGSFAPEPGRQLFAGITLEL